MGARPFFVAGEWRVGEGILAVENPYDGTIVAEVGRATIADVEDAVAAAAAAFEETRKMPAHRRADALAHVSLRIVERAEELAETIAREGGKPIKWARVETVRAASTFRWAAEEARRQDGDVLRLDTDASLGSRLGIVRRFPVGPVLGITPFNFPLNLVAHKVAPAIAAGAPIVVKPASATPLTALLLAEIVSEADLPRGILSVLTASSGQAEALVRDPRFAKLSFTGSSEVGWHLKGLDPRKRVTLELGGNAGVIVHEDADLARAAERAAFGSNYQGGQSCIAVQLVLVHERVHDRFAEELVAAVGALHVGDPMDPEVDVGPLVNQAALDRVSSWVEEAVEHGAEVLCGGKREDPLYHPTVLARTTREMKVRCEEVFGPVLTLASYRTFEEALGEVNDSRYGLQAGVFTNDMNLALLAHRELEVGGVIVNDVATFRIDQMPYGGAKDSGFGREGVRYAMAEMTEPRLLVLSHVPL
jgi:aldehyde dehydrogenase (NAD+)